MFPGNVRRLEMFATTVMTVLCARGVSHFVCDSSTSKPNAEAWEQVPQQEKSHLVAACPSGIARNWPQRTENGKTQGVISQSPGEPNGAADPEGFSAVGTPR
jgi:hypothetical protein